MKRLLVGLVALLAVGLGDGDEGTAAPKGTLTIGIPTDINTLDPTMGPEVNSLNVAFSTMEPLLRLDAQGNLKPLLAESWEVVDNTTYVFRLRKNVKFHNGEPFNGRAVEYSWKRARRSTGPTRPRSPRSPGSTTSTTTRSGSSPTSPTRSS